jgi:hypothetical protein
VTNRRRAGRGTDLRSLRSLCEELRDHLERRSAALSEEVRSYPTPIARCDEQLSGLLEQRASVFRQLDRLTALADRDLSREDCAALIREFMSSAARPDDESEARIRSRVTAELPELAV